MSIRNWAIIGYGIVLAAFVVLPVAGVYPILLINILFYTIFAAAFHLLLGYGGLLSLGHAAFFGSSGYLAGYFVVRYGVSPELALLAGVCSGALLGFGVGVLSIRRSGIYFAMITLAFAQLVYFICLQLPATGGEDGMQGIERGRLFGLLDLHNDVTLYYCVLVLTVLVLLAIARIVHSPYGDVLRAIKDNESRVMSLGYDTYLYKLILFILSAGFTGLAGSIKALSQGFVTLSDVHWLASGDPLVMSLVGGVGFLSGPVVGATLIVTLLNRTEGVAHELASWTGIEAIGTFGSSAVLIVGLFFILCALGFRGGIMGSVTHWVAQLSGKRGRPARLRE